MGARLAASLSAIGLMVRLAGFRRSVKIAWWIADHLPDAPSETRGPFEIADTRAKEIRAVAQRIPYDLKCLPQSLLLATLLRRREIAGELCLGARVDRKFEAHAWVEIDGVPVDQDDDLKQRFRCLLRVPLVPL